MRVCAKDAVVVGQDECDGRARCVVPSRERAVDHRSLGIHVREFRMDFGGCVEIMGANVDAIVCNSADNAYPGVIDDPVDIVERKIRESAELDAVVEAEADDASGPEAIIEVSQGFLIVAREPRHVSATTCNASKYDSSPFSQKSGDAISIEQLRHDDLSDRHRGRFCAMRLPECGRRH